MPNAKILRFELKTLNIQPLAAKCFAGRTVSINQKKWRDKEARSCAVTKIDGGSIVPGSTTLPVAKIEVTYHPPGHISTKAGKTYNGWDEVPSGTGGTPTTKFPEIDFNTLDFGDFIEEVDEPTP